jgi:hypothetical protein
MRRLAWALVALLASSGTAQAFSIGTSLSSPCHEKITLKAVVRSNVDKPEGWMRDWPHQEQSWLKVAHWLEEEGFIEDKQDDRWRLLQVSLFVGARYPDQRGFGITDLQGLREIHLSGDTQHEHCLRGPDQDGETGDAQALQTTRQYIRNLILQARSPVDTWSMAGHMKSVSAWIEFYGDVDVLVWEPAFLMAKALHTFQDSFSHTYRSADLSRIYAVCNFIDAIAGHYDEHRDGPRHSLVTDVCDDPEVEPLKTTAIQASTELFNAGLEYMNTNDMTAVDQVLDKWLALEPGCGYDNGYCGTPWAEVAKRKETHPFGCSYASGRTVSLPCLLLALGGLVVVRWRRRRPSSATTPSPVDPE